MLELISRAIAWADVTGMASPGRRVFVVTILALVASTPQVVSESARLPGDPIVVELKEPGRLFEAKYGRRSVSVDLLETDSFELRLRIWPLLGEPVEHYVFRTPQLSALTFEADAGYVNRVEINSIGGDQGENYISGSYGDGLVEIYVSQDVLDRIGYSGFTFSLETHGLFPLPDQFYDGSGDPRRMVFPLGEQAYIHSRNPGVLGSPGKWGWDVPGSPSWGNFLSPYEHPLDEAEHVLREDRRMDAEAAKEAFRRMLYLHHVKKDKLFVNNWFSIQNLEVSASDILGFIHEHRPEAYRKIMERERPAEKDAEVMGLMATLSDTAAGARDERGIIQTSGEIDRRIATIDQTVAGYGAEVSDDLRQEWAGVQQQYIDAAFQRRLAGFEPMLSALTGETVGNVSDDMKAQIARLRADAEGTASLGLRHRIEALERVVNIRHQPDISNQPEMVEIPGGSFRMGCVSGRDCDDLEHPVHTVRVERFELGKYEVTFEEYDRFTDATGWERAEDEGWGRGRRPVINVSWEDAVAYTKWLSAKTGDRYRLPSEAEREYAARAGSETRYHFGNDESGLCQYGNHADTSTDYDWRNQTCSDGVGKQTAPVGSYGANQFGLHDMHGNVWEWLQDCWNESYRGAPSDGTAWERGDCSWRVLRGGSWGGHPGDLRSARRVRLTSASRDYDLGFRVARTVTP